MAGDPGSGCAVWRGAAEIRAERGRRRLFLRCTYLALVFFAYGLAQVWMATQAAERSSRITALKAACERLETDLTVARTRMAQDGTYGRLMVPAERTGFVQTQDLRTILVQDGDQPVGSGIFRRAAAGLQASSRALLPVALAQNRDAGSGGHGQRP